MYRLASRGHNDDLPAIVESSQVLLSANAAHLHAIVFSHLIERGLGDVHVQTECDSEELTLRHGDQVELLRPLIGNQQRTGVLVYLEHATLDLDVFAGALALRRGHRDSRKRKHESYGECNASLRYSLGIVLIFISSLPVARFENWGRGLKASASPRAVDIFGRRAQFTSSASLIVEGIPQMFGK